MKLRVLAIAVFALANFCVASPPVTPSAAAPRVGEGGASANVQFAGEKVANASDTALQEVQAISNDIQKLKAQVVELNKDLRLMEEELLFPSNTKYSVFVSLSGGQFFQLEGLKFKLDGKFVATHVYSEKQRLAMARGGVHRLFITNLSEGKHTVTAFFTGIGSNGRPYKRAASLDFTKGAGSEFLEIAVGDDDVTQEPVFDLKQW